MRTELKVRKGEALSRVRYLTLRMRNGGTLLAVAIVSGRSSLVLSRGGSFGFAPPGSLITLRVFVYRGTCPEFSTRPD